MINFFNGKVEGTNKKSKGSVDYCSMVGRVCKGKDLTGVMETILQSINYSHHVLEPKLCLARELLPV